mmetsp:Transcript_15728/g.39235  ORF Transcript_15728/g.39235 Transcript_15728/m.39235 type:complete len:230 (-) Transcript_15728:61-750(-)
MHDGSRYHHTAAQVLVHCSTRVRSILSFRPVVIHAGDHVPQLLDNCRCCRPLARAFRQAPGQQFGVGGLTVQGQVREQRVRLVAPLLQPLHPGRLVSGHLPHDDAQAVDVCSLGHARLAQHLGRHVEGRAGRVVGHVRGGRVERDGQTKVAQLGAAAARCSAVLLEQHVVGLEVAVYDVALVQECDTLGNIQEDVQQHGQVDDGAPRCVEELLLPSLEQGCLAQLLDEI